MNRSVNDKSEMATHNQSANAQLQQRSQRLTRSLPLAACLMGVLAIAAIAPKSIAQDTAPDSIDIPADGIDATRLIPTDEAVSQIVNVTVTSDADGITADQAITLREAIHIVNGTLPLSALSQAEAALVSPAAQPYIDFALVGDTRIELQTILPAITAAGLTVDGTTQIGYGDTPDEPAITPVPSPVVSITPAANTEVFRGLTITADEVTIRGLSLYGFSSIHRATASTPPADIFISHIAPVMGSNRPLRRRQVESARTLRLDASEHDQAPTGVIIEDNWLGLSPDGSIPVAEEMSAFGVSVFNATNAVVQRNRIAYHESSGIITTNLATGLVVTENTVIGNGLRGLPAALYFAGNIDGAQVFSNLVCANDGSGVAMFKPEGSAQIYSNDIRFNGRRIRSPGIALMGSGHEVTDNYVAFQPGPGVGVVAYPKSEQNMVRGNFFRRLDGLSVDLTSNYGVQVSDYQFNDGPNPPRNSNQRRRDTANAAINAPEFDEYVFSTAGGSTTVTGRADPGSEVDIYAVSTKNTRHYGNLGNLLTTVNVAEDGTFSATVDAPEGSEVSAIATDMRYGTSEPSPVAAIGSEPPESPAPVPYAPVCQDPPLITEVIEPPPDEPISLRIPRNIHFGLDRSFISAESAVILDQIASAMAQYPSLTVELQGHTDPRASDEYNQALGERRSLSARDYLLQRGIEPERMRIRSFGETQTISTSPDIVDYARDRRVEFIFSDSRGLDIIFERQESDLQIE